LRKDKRWRVVMRKGQLDIISGDGDENRPATGRARQSSAEQRRRETSQQSAVMRCAKLLQSHLKGGWLPVTTLETAARRAGFRPNTFKTAGKRLGLQRRRVGYGREGEWQVSLPTRKMAKT
jgi:hypothetical protein